MSPTTWLAPKIAAYLLGPDRLERQRAQHEERRRRQGKRHQVHYFHQVDDPYSALAAAALPVLETRFDIDIVPHVVGTPSDAAAPERAKLNAYSRRDAQMLARRHALAFDDPGAEPAPAAVAHAAAQLVGAAAAGRFVGCAGVISARLWQAVANPGDAPNKLAGSQAAADAAAPADAASIAAHLRASEALRARLGHYLGAMFFYAGEWYWGIDRLHYLEDRLQALGAIRSGSTPSHGYHLFPPDTNHDAIGPAARGAPPVDFFFSLRSPYSAIVAPRIFALGKRYGAEVRLRFVLPMVMRGLPAPRPKRLYICFDTAREARRHGTPFGRAADPVGRPTERGLALIPFAERAGLGQAYVLSFMRGVWAEGADAGSDRGLRRIVESAGLSWELARIALQDESWRERAEANRQALFGLGLWGVPSFRIDDGSRDLAVWGQDRIWAIEEALQRAAAAERNVRC